MALTSRIRRALGQPSRNSTRTSSTSSSSSASAVDLSHHLDTQQLPAMALTKTTSPLGRIASWRAERKRGKWVEPKTKYPGVVNAKHQEMLRGFEMKFGRQGGRPSLDGRASIWSGVSPMASRRCSVDEQRTGAFLAVPLSRRVSRDDGGVKAEGEAAEQ